METSGDDLSAAEKRFLIEHGGAGITEDLFTPEAMSDALAERRQNQAAAWAEASSTSVTATVLSARFGWTEEEIQRMHRAGDMYAFVPPDGDEHLFPRWQFTDEEPLPGLRHVLPHIPASWHPLDVEEWMTTGNEGVPGDVSPAAWLTDDGDPKVISAAMVAEIIAW